MKYIVSNSIIELFELYLKYNNIQQSDVFDDVIVSRYGIHYGIKSGDNTVNSTVTWRYIKYINMLEIINYS